MSLRIDIERLLERAENSFRNGQLEEAAKAFSMAANYFRIIGDMPEYISKKRLAAKCFLSAGAAHVRDGDLGNGFVCYSHALNCFKELGESRSCEACIQQMLKCISEENIPQIDFRIARKMAQFLAEVGDDAGAAKCFEILGENALENGNRYLNALLFSEAASCYSRQGIAERASRLHTLAAESYAAVEKYYEASSELVLASLYRIMLRDFPGAYYSASKAREFCDAGGIFDVWQRQIVEVCLRLASRDTHSASTIWRSLSKKFKPSFVMKVEEAFKASELSEVF